MSRRWLTALLFVLAVTFQVMTPVVNGVAASRGMDPVVVNDICLKVAGAAHDHEQAPAHSHHRHHDCALCQAFCDGVAPVSARPYAIGTASVQWSRLRWTVADHALPASPRDFARQARAPPIFS